VFVQNFDFVSKFPKMAVLSHIFCIFGRHLSDSKKYRKGAIVLCLDPSGHNTTGTVSKGFVNKSAIVCAL